MFLTLRWRHQPPSKGEVRRPEGGDGAAGPYASFLRKRIFALP